jgi:hypothetical protein
MANINDFKNIKKKSKQYYNFLKADEVEEDLKARLGFYLFAIECISGIKDIDEISELILDNEYNKIVNKMSNDDLGIDAVTIDHENNEINLYAFKYYKDFNADRSQGENAVALTTKFLSLIRSLKPTNGYTKTEKTLDIIIELVKSSTSWDIKLNYVSNDSKGFNPNKEPIIQELEDVFGMQVRNYTLNDLVDFITLIPKPVKAKILVDHTAVLTYEESELSSEKSYLVRIPVLELIKITSNDPGIRMEIDRDKVLMKIKDLKLNHDVLFDNVRGYLGDTKYNKNILKTLVDDFSKFFMYNNGITATAKSIYAKEVNLNTKLELEMDTFQIVNGGQTLKTIYKALETAYNEKAFINAEVLLRIFSTKGTDSLTNEIAEFTNSQNSISDTNLKSLDIIQLQIEQQLKMDDILYVRKVGETGLDNRTYKLRISMEKFAQIVYSSMGFPDRASNQKKRLFNTYYNDVFKNNFDIEKSKEYIETYNEIIEYYKSGDLEHFEQKYFYAIYLVYKGKNTENAVSLIEKTLSEFKKEEQISDARKLLQVSFRELLDENAAKSGS